MHIFKCETGYSIMQYATLLRIEDPENERVALEGMLRYIDMAAELQSGIVIGWAKGNIRESSSREAYFEKLTKNLRILDEAAAKCNVPIVVEVINHYEVDVFKTARETYSYLKENHFRNCFVHLDTFHMLLEEENFVKAIQTASPRLGYFHFADTTRWHPGSGYMDYKPILRTLDEVGYHGYLTIECFPHDNAKDAAVKGLRYLKSVESALF